MLQFLTHALKQNHKPGYLHTAAGAACAGASKHQNHQKGLGKLRPHVKINGGKSRRCHDGADLECRRTNSVARSRKQASRIQHNQSCGDKQHQKVTMHLFHRKSAERLFLQQQKVKTEVYPKQRHKHGNDPLQVRRIACRTVVSDAKTAGTGRTERNGDRLKQAHAAKQ